MTLPLHCNPLLLHYSMSLLTSLLTYDLPFIRVAQPLTLHKLHLTTPAWAQTPSRLWRLIVFNVMPQAISVLIALSTNVPAVTNRLPATHNITASEIIAPSVIVSPTWPATAPIDGALSVMLPITFSSIVLLRRTQAPESFSTRETLRGCDVVPVVQAFDGGIVMVRGHGLVLSIVHLPLLTVDSPLTFTVLVFFLTDTF